MLAWMTVFACALYLAPLAALIVLLRRGHDGVLALAFVIPVVFAADLLATFALCYLYPVERAAFVRTILLTVAVIAIVARRAWRRQPIMRPRGALSGGDLVALGVAMLVGFYLSYDVS